MIFHYFSTHVHGEPKCKKIRNNKQIVCVVVWVLYFCSIRRALFIYFHGSVADLKHCVHTAVW